MTKSHITFHTKTCWIGFICCLWYHFLSFCCLGCCTRDALRTEMEGLTSQIGSLFLLFISKPARSRKEKQNKFKQTTGQTFKDLNCFLRDIFLLQCYSEFVLQCQRIFQFKFQNSIKSCWNFFLFAMTMQ